MKAYMTYDSVFLVVESDRHDLYFNTKDGLIDYQVDKMDSTFGVFIRASDKIDADHLNKTAPLLQFKYGTSGYVMANLSSISILANFA